MRAVTLSILLASAAVFASAANAQEAPTLTPSDPSTPGAYTTPGKEPPVWDGDAWRHVYAPVRGNRAEIGVAALKANDFALAEESLASFLRRKPTNADANLYMGVAKMNLGKWEAAKEHLEIAVAKKPKHPDPKSRLGVTYAKLGDIAGAKAQRTELVKMAEACEAACRLSPYIIDGIEMIDEALAESPSSSS